MNPIPTPNHRDIRVGTDLDAGAAIRQHPADLPLVLQEQLALLAERRDAEAPLAELADLVDELLRLRDWRFQ